jgi:hypothetical protein
MVSDIILIFQHAAVKVLGKPNIIEIRGGKEGGEGGRRGRGRGGGGRGLIKTSGNSPPG